MGWEAGVYLFTIVLPILFMHFGLLADARVDDKLEGQKLSLSDLRRLEVLVPFVFAFLWFMAGYFVASYGAHLMESEVRSDPLRRCVRQLEQVNPQLADAYHFLWAPQIQYDFASIVVPTVAIRTYAHRRYRRGKSVGYLEVFLFWIVGTLIYVLIAGRRVSQWLGYYHYFANLCGIPPV